MRLGSPFPPVGVPPDFNPRTREGCDLVLDGHARRITNFNPRTREGCDKLTEVESVEVYISIHAPVKGATSMSWTVEPGAE